jgi:hypothetical protein
LKLGHVAHCRTIALDTLRLQARLDFTLSSELWTWIEPRCRSNTTTYLVAHNIVFDLAVTDGFSELARRGWTLEALYSKGITAIFRWRKGRKKLIGIDNTNLFPGKLEKWGEVLGLPKLEINFNTVSDSDLAIYCRRDVDIMLASWRNWLSFLDVHDLGAFKMTVGATALNAWRHRFMPVAVHIHSNPKALELERESYHGGRVECLWTGKRQDGPFYYLDVNSMYGYVLSRYNFPAGLSGYVETDEISLLIRRLERHSVIARVLIETDTPWYPVFYQKQIVYPTGMFWATLTTPEIIHAGQAGALRGVSAVAWYRQAPLFSKFVHYFYELRQSYHTDELKAYNNICKLLINSLYGKFGQLGMRQEKIGECPVDQIWSSNGYDIAKDEYFRQFALAGGVYEERRSGEAYNAFPAIAAHVTAYARLYLYRLVQKVPAGHVFYMDTDSLVVDEIGKQALFASMNSSRLGALKVEHSSQTLEIYAPKDYKMDGRNRTKGIRSDAVQIAPDVYQQVQFSRLEGLIRQGSLTGAVTRMIEKRLDRRVRSGLVLASGWIEPFRLYLEAEQAESLGQLSLPLKQSAESSQSA